VTINWIDILIRAILIIIGIILVGVGVSKLFTPGETVENNNQQQQPTNQGQTKQEEKEGTPKEDPAVEKAEGSSGGAEELAEVAA
jgi:uncharacterized membrane protein YraQ (UPF0718 family)